jgi:hypothetical protein
MWSNQYKDEKMIKGITWWVFSMQRGPVRKKTQLQNGIDGNKEEKEHLTVPFTSQPSG